jgi:hypothetical protein
MVANAAQRPRRNGNHTHYACPYLPLAETCKEKPSTTVYTKKLNNVVIEK